MMNINWDEVLDIYIRWIKDNTAIRGIRDGNTAELVTPFLDRHNDHLQIYVIKQGSDFMLTDDGYTIEDLRMSGLEMSTPKREKILKVILNGFGVKIGNRHELYTEANLSNLAQKKHYLLQAILAVNDMHTLSQESVYSLFKEDVELYFKSNEIFYSKDIKITGKTGFDHNVDFLISASRSKPERLIKTINTPSKDSIMAAIFSFSDIQAVRDVPTSNFVIYNDIDKPVAGDAIGALSNYGFTSIPWSQREKCKQEFVTI